MASSESLVRIKCEYKSQVRLFVFGHLEVEWSVLEAKVKDAFKLPANCSISAFYVDEDGDSIQIDTDSELKDLAKIERIPKLTIAVFSKVNHNSSTTNPIAVPSGEKDLFEGSSELDQQQQPQQKQDSQPQQAPPNLVLDFSEIIAGVQKLGTQISENPEVINSLMKSMQVVTESVQPMVESLARVINDPGCTVCGTKLGSLYKCQTCLNYNLCESCYFTMNQQQYSADTGSASILHDSSHVFTRILRPADEADNKKAVIEGQVEQVIAMGDAAAVAGASRERIRELVVHFGGDLDRVVQALNDECLD